MPKGYWIGRVDVSDADAYRKYVVANAEPFARFGAKFLIRGGRFECVEGDARERNVVIEFPSFEAARACYEDPAYQRAKPQRAGASEGYNIVIQGYDGPQPGD